MNQSIAVLCVAVGGGVGSVARFLISNVFLRWLGPEFPWGTFAINVTGAFAIGVVLEASRLDRTFHPYVRLFLATGVLGGYTTFSTFAYETYTLGVLERPVEALLYAGGSVVVGIAAAVAGVLAARAALPA